VLVLAEMARSSARLATSSL